MIAKRFRLPARQIKKIFRSGRKCGENYLQIYSLPRHGQPRFAIIVSTKIAKGAVLRNRMKRLCRVAIIENFPQTSADFVIVVKKNFINKEQEAKAELKECLSKIS